MIMNNVRYCELYRGNRLSFDRLSANLPSRSFYLNKFLGVFVSVL